MLRRMLPSGVVLAFIALLLAMPATPSRAADDAIVSIDSDGAAPGPQPNGVVLVASPEIAIDVDIQGADAIGAFEFEAIYDPSYLAFTRWAPGPFLGSSGRSTSCTQLVGATTLRIGCGTIGSTLPAGPSGDGVLATLYFRPRVVGQTCLLMSVAATSDVLGNSLATSGASGCVWIVSGEQDKDGDGCSDAAELASSHLLGGQRDPLNNWDFFDVSVPALTPANYGGARDHSVSIADVLAVLVYVGTAEGRGMNLNGVVYNGDLDGDRTADGSEYDRSPGNVAGQPWRSGPPDGAVTIKDAVVALNQIGDHCIGTA